MKKFLAIFCSFMAFSAPSQATGVFIGADALYSQARFTTKNISELSGPLNGSVRQGNKINYGANAGIRFDLLNLLASGEVFYDSLQAEAKNFETAAGEANKINSVEIKDRYGAKANLGFAIFPRITPFLTYGFAKVKYSGNAGAFSVTDSKWSPIYGLGLLLDLPLGVSLKAAYDYQQFSIPYSQSGSKTRTNLGVAKLGVIYNF
jgi:opacity protein-like surface antigen